MTRYYKDYGITFGTLHSYNDLGMVMTSDPIMPPPKMRQRTVEIPGRSGAVDLSTALTGYHEYEPRTFEYSFALMYGDANEVMSALHGKKMRCVDDRDPDKYFDAVLSVSFDGRETANAHQIITVSAYLADPWRYDKDITEYTIVMQNEDPEAPGEEIIMDWSVIDGVVDDIDRAVIPINTSPFFLSQIGVYIGSGYLDRTMPITLATYRGDTCMESQILRYSEYGNQDGYDFYDTEDTAYIQYTGQLDGATHFAIQAEALPERIRLVVLSNAVHATVPNGDKPAELFVRATCPTLYLNVNGKTERVKSGSYRLADNYLLAPSSDVVALGYIWNPEGAIAPNPFPAGESVTLKWRKGWF